MTADTPDTPESDVLAAIAQLEREDAEQKWWDAPERAFRRGARMTVDSAPRELRAEVTPPGHGAFIDAYETSYGRAEPVHESASRYPSFRNLAPPSEPDDVRRIREWTELMLRRSRDLQFHVYCSSSDLSVLLPDCYPEMERVCGMSVQHLPLRGGYVVLRYEDSLSGMGKAMDTYQVLERARVQQPWIVAGRESLSRIARSGGTFIPPIRVQFRQVPEPGPIQLRLFSELWDMCVVDLPSCPHIYVGFSMIIPGPEDLDRELQRQRRRDEYSPIEGATEERP